MVSTLTTLKCPSMPTNFTALASELLISLRLVIPCRRRFLSSGDTLMVFKSLTYACLYYVAPVVKTVWISWLFAQDPQCFMLWTYWGFLRTLIPALLPSYIERNLCLFPCWSFLIQSHLLFPAPRWHSSLDPSESPGGVPLWGQPQTQINTYCGSVGGAVVNNLPAKQVMQERQSDSWVGNIPQSRRWQPTPVFLPGKLHGQWSLGV